MTSVFISYRRSDTSGYAGRLYDRLASHFGAPQVFIDVDHIEPGDDFARTIDARIHTAGVVLVLIGPGWLDAADAHGRPRLHLDDDYVRIEIATALQQGKTVIPVLFRRASMPARGRLPLDLQALATRQAFSCSDERFHADVDVLVAALERKPGRRWRKAATGDGGWRRYSRSVSWLRRIAVVSAIGSAGLAGLAQIADSGSTTGGDFARPRTTSTSQTPPARVRVDTPSASRLVESQSTLTRVRPAQLPPREVIDRYNRTARNIIDSLGR